MIILLIALLVNMPAYGKSKTASTRVAEVFQMLPHGNGIAIKPPPRYIADRPAYFVMGKMLIYRECEVDLVQDPAEHSCRMVFAWI